jgi:glyoxylase-like metal-dependent hydrolase (beta-lactamase superfamily II)
MKELAHNIFIETDYPGVTLGAINWKHSMVLIDAPLRLEDIRTWRSTLLNLGAGSERLLINLDAHYDRTVGARSMDCTIIGHEKMASVFHNRPITFKSQSTEIGALSELYDSIGSIRWAPPDITFSKEMQLNDENASIILEYRPGNASGSIWVRIPEEKIIFIGDSVVVNQPPFLAFSHIPTWVETLQQLLLPEYREYIIVSGRGGIIRQEQVKKQIEWLTRVEQKLNDLASAQATADDTEKMIPLLLREYNQNIPELPMFKRRLKFGLNQYFTRNYSQPNG